jgi:hypothetical protein
MSGTEYWERRVLDAVFHGVEFRVTQAYVGLGATDGQGGIVELTAGDYNRKTIPWSPVTDDSISTAQQVMWSPSSSWGTITRAFISDSAQGGNVLFETTVSITVGSGSKIIIDPGDMTVT